MKTARLIHILTAISAVLLAVSVTLGLSHPVVTAFSLLPGGWVGGFVGSRVVDLVMARSSRRRTMRRAARSSRVVELRASRAMLPN